MRNHTDPHHSGAWPQLRGRRRADRVRRALVISGAAIVVSFVAPAIAYIGGARGGGLLTVGFASASVAFGAIVLVVVRLLRRIAHQQAHFESERRRWQDEAFTDPLCRVANRRGGLHELELRRLVARPGDRLTVAAVDVDRFKQVNDRHGHAVGDRVLVSVAEALSARAPEGAVVARWGGDEFVVLHIGAPGAGGLDRHWAHDVVEEVAARVVPCREGELRISVSVGVATAEPDADVERVLAVADDRLRGAKAERRSSVVLPVPGREVFPPPADPVVGELDALDAVGELDARADQAGVVDVVNAVPSPELVDVVVVDATTADSSSEQFSLTHAL